MARFTHPNIDPINVSPIDDSLVTSTIHTYAPTWSGTGLTFTGTPATGSYIKIGNIVLVQIDVVYTTVANFGTGQYSLTLPFASKFHTDVYGGSAHDTSPTLTHYSLKGHLTPGTVGMTLWQHAGSSADAPMKHNVPFNATTVDKFHMSFSYICE
jgi:hypothetical protein